MGQWLGSNRPKEYHVLYCEKGAKVIPLRWPTTYAYLIELLEELYGVTPTGVYVQDAVYTETRNMWVSCEESFHAIVPRRNEKIGLYYAMLTLPSPQ